MKNNNGITLIALVVTIIVLLILAGVSIAMLTGQNGILNKASEASWKTKIEDAVETLNYAATEAIADYYKGAYVNNTVTPSDANVVTAIENAITNTTVSGVTKSEIATHKFTLTYNGHTKYAKVTDKGIQWSDSAIDE